MKKIIALFLSLVFLISLTACGAGSPVKKESAASESQAAGTKEETQASSTEAPETEGSKVTEVTEETVPETTEKISFDEITVVDNEECAIKIVAIDPDNLWGYTLKIFLENKSSEKNYMYALDKAAVNNVHCDPLFADTVAPGKKANEEINFMSSLFCDNDIGPYTDIELTFRVYDSDDWTADPVAFETVHVYPMGEDAAKPFVREVLPTDQVLVDNDQFSVVALGYQSDDIWGYSVKLFFVNKTDKNIMFSVEDASVNGFMADPFFASSVPAGKCTFSDLDWSKSAFEENGIELVHTIEFTLRAYDDDNWTADDLLNTKIVLTPES